MMTDFCLYHKEKSSFEEAQKFLQSSRWIPRQYVHRLAMAICSCRKFKGEVATAEALKVQIDYLKEFLESVNETSERRPPGVLQQWVAECCDLTDSYSHVRLVTILYNAQHKNFKLLQRENVSSNKMDLPPQKKKSHKQTLTASQIECIARKRKKKYASTMVKLDMFPGNKQKFEESLGNNFLKTNKCYLEYPKDLNNRMFENNIKVTYVKLQGRYTGMFNSISTILKTKSEALQKDLDEARVRRRNYWYTRTRGADHLDHGVTEALKSIDKDQLAADFELKSWNQHKAKCHPKKPVSPVLQGGHCLQCLKPYTGLKDSSICTYHPGYLNYSGVWNCCGVKSDFDSHLETGCTTSVQHNWRPHAKRGRSSEKKVAYADSQYARTRHVKHRYGRHRK